MEQTLQLKPWTLLQGDSRQRLREFPDNHFHSCVMDGPYGFRFMGAVWDTFDIEKKGAQRDSYKPGESRLANGRNSTGFGNSIEAGKYNQSLEANRNFQAWFTELAIEIIRVLRPGGYLLSFGGPRTAHRMIAGIEDAGFEIRDVITWMFASGFPKSHNLKEHGVGTALKPAYEPICMARKPLDGTVQQNFEKWGTGVLHIDRSRVHGEPWTFGTQTDIKGGNYGTNRPENGNVFAKNVTGGELGRWPANILHDGSPEVLSLFPDSKGQMADVKGDDSGSAGRFFHSFQHDEEDLDFIHHFYCPKTSRKDRNEGVIGPRKPLIWSSGTQNPGSFQSENTDRSSQNNHPTVKPTALMAYLVRLVTPIGGKCVDPTCGSGSTGKGCVQEDVEFTGIDLEQQWIDISDQRITWAWNKHPKIK